MEQLAECAAPLLLYLSSQTTRDHQKEAHLREQRPCRNCRWEPLSLPQAAPCHWSIQDCTDTCTTSDSHTQTRGQSCSESRWPSEMCSWSAERRHRDWAQTPIPAGESERDQECRCPSRHRCPEQCPPSQEAREHTKARRE